MGRKRTRVKVREASIKKEMKEHPWASKKQAEKIAIDHAKKRKGKK